MIGALSIARAALEVPRRPALVLGGREITFAELAERVGRVATWLGRRSIWTPKASIALVPRLDVETVATLLAAIEVGARVVLLHPRLTSHERRELVADASPDLVLEDVAAELAEAQACEPSSLVVPATGDDRPLAILYTSGTTGRAKGAVLSRRAFLAAAEASAANLGWEDGDRWLLCMPLAHVGGLSILVRALHARRTVVIPESDKFDPALVARVMERDRVTLCSFVPTMLKKLVETTGGPLPAHVRAVLLGGAAAPGPLLEMARELSLPVLTTYGLTEACSQVTTQRYGTPAGPEQGSGHPVLGSKVRIVDDRIEVHGPSLMSGYHGIAESPLLEDGWLRTEDFGRIDDEGRLHVLGRRQELVVTGGENVYPLEVERHLETIAGVEAACVFGVPDETWGEIVCAAVVRRADAAALSAAELMTRAGERVARHKVPRRIAFVDALPATAAGKLDRRAVVALVLPLLAP